MLGGVLIGSGPAADAQTGAAAGDSGATTPGPAPGPITDGGDCASIEQAFETVVARIVAVGRDSDAAGGLTGLARRQGTLIGLHGEAGCDPAPLVSVMRAQGAGLDRLYRALALAKAANRPEPRYPSSPVRRGGSPIGVPGRPAPLSQTLPAPAPPADRGAPPVQPAPPKPPVPAAETTPTRPRRPATPPVAEPDPLANDPMAQLADALREQGLGGETPRRTRGRPLQLPPEAGLPAPGLAPGLASSTLPLPNQPPPAVLPGGAPPRNDAPAVPTVSTPVPLRTRNPLTAVPATNVQAETAPESGPVIRGPRSGRLQPLPPGAAPPAVTRAGQSAVRQSLGGQPTIGTMVAPPSRQVVPAAAAKPALSRPRAAPTGGALVQPTLAVRPQPAPGSQPASGPQPAAPPPAVTAARPVATLGQATGGQATDPGATDPAATLPAGKRVPIFYATRNVNLRHGPGTNTKKVGLLTAGTAVAVLGRTGNDSWLQVQTRDGRRGYAYARLMSAQPPGAVDSGAGSAAVADQPPPDGPDLVAEVERRARRGDTEAQFALGNFYLNFDMAQALRWWGTAARNNHPGAQYNMGLALMTGRGVQRNQAEALSYWRAAAGNGHPQAKAALRQIEGGR